MRTHLRKPALKRRSALLLGASLLATAAATSVGLATAPQAAAASNLHFRFELSVDRWAINTGKDNGTTVNGANAQIWSWAHRAPHDWNSQWEMTYKHGKFDYFELKNRWSNQCLDVEGTGFGAEVEQQPCDDTNSQRWKITHDGSGQNRYFLVNKWATLSKGHDMVATSFGTTMGSAVKLWSNYGGADQIWGAMPVYHD